MAIILYISNLFQSPAIFISIVACIGLIIQKKSISDIIKGTFKAMLGILVLLVGVDVIMAAMNPLSNAFGMLVNSTGGQLADYGAFMGQFGSQIGLIMVVGFIFNLLVARFTPLKTVYLTGHMMLFFAMGWLGLGVEFGFTGMGLMCFSTIGYLVTITLTPQLLMKDMEFLTGKREFTVGHAGTLFCFIASRIGQLCAGRNGEKKSASMEEIKFPKKLDFLRDTTLTSGLIMVIVYAIIAIFLPSQARLDIYGTDVFTFTLTNGMKFGAGILILLQGCRLMMSELIPAFSGISNKVVPGAVPALDIPLIYPYGPNSLMIGFVIATISSLVTMVVINFSSLSSFVVLPVVAAVYFDVASGSVFANAYGGRKGVIVWNIIGGILIMLVIAVAMPLVANTVGTFVQQMGFSENNIWIIIIGYITKFIKMLFA